MYGRLLVRNGAYRGKVRKSASFFVKKQPNTGPMRHIEGFLGNLPRKIRINEA